MMRRALLPLLLVLTAVTGCTSGGLAATPDPSRPPSVDGEWVIEREITAATDEGTGVPGAVDTLFVLFTEEACTESECTGSVVSGISLEERELAPVTGTYVSTVDGMAYEFEEVLTPCIADAGGGVIAQDAYGSRVSYDATFDDAEAETVAAFAGTGVRILRTTPVGIDLGVCRVIEGEIEYRVTATRGD